LSLRILIVDDEPLARRRIRQYLALEHADAAVTEAGDGAHALAVLARTPVDIVFLDIEMPELSGFDVVRLMPEANRPAVVFQTAYDQFALKAFEVNACDYLLKPFPDERLAAAMERAVARSVTARAAALAGLGAALVADKRYLARLVLQVGARQRVVEAGEVAYFLSDQHLTRVFLTTGSDYVYDASLTQLEESLDPAAFVRLHRNSVVNLASVASIERGARMTVVLKDGTSLKVARERRARLAEALAAFTVR
jgi:two-component system LytT family response regulator